MQTQVIRISIQRLIDPVEHSEMSWVLSRHPSQLFRGFIDRVSDGVGSGSDKRKKFKSLLQRRQQRSHAQYGDNLMCNLDGRTFKKPRLPYEKEHLDAELKLVGEYGLRCKRELWRVQYALSRIRNATRMLLTLDEKHPHRIFEGEALLRRMNIYELLDES
ncbi:hypothetical protein KY285_000566 [Solanum tuberosum]|nr:hypothetical protein KY285_000566 [Solanum tuberosum]